jgi:hypothetical protein
MAAFGATSGDSHSGTSFKAWKAFTVSQSENGEYIRGGPFGPSQHPQHLDGTILLARHLYEHADCQSTSCKRRLPINPDARCEVITVDNQLDNACRQIDP